MGAPDQKTYAVGGKAVGVEIAPGWLAVSFRTALDKALNLFKQRNKAAETLMNQRTEERWARQYMANDLPMNLAEVFAVRLTNYSANGSTIESADEAVNDVLNKLWAKLYKWLPLGIAIGRVYLLPYICGDQIYISFVPQSQVIETDIAGDQVIGFVCVADTKSASNKTYCRIEHYAFDRATRSYSITNKAVEKSSGAEVDLSVIPAWGKIQPVLVFTGVDAPLFGYVDSPRDNRLPSKPAGAGILYGCDNTVREIMECIKQYETEYSNKVSVLGVNQTMLANEFNPATGQSMPGAVSSAQLPPRYIKYDAIGKLGADQSDLFSVFSPDIRSQSYQERLLELFGRLERQVGTSAGILTPADTAQATATQVRRTMYDTLCMVDRIQASIEQAVDAVAYATSMMLAAIGKPTGDYTPSITWGDGMEQAKDEHFQMMAQAHSAGVISDAEFRQEVYPNESIEEAQAAVEKIRAEKPDPLEAMFPPEAEE